MIKKAMAAGLLALLLLAITACGNKNGNSIEKMPEQENSVMNIDINKFSWTREPQSCVIKGDTIEVVTKPKTLAFSQEAEAQSQSPCPLYGASVEHGDLYCGHQENCAFAMHSVMKFPQALYVADYLHKKGLTLNDSILVHKDSLDAATWSPMLSRFEGTRYFTFAELIEWSLKQSDNNACDLLFASCGKPEAVEKYIHSLGFKDIHVQLTEKDMKKSPHRAAENSSTPKEMTRLLEWFYLHRDDNKNLSFIWDTMADCNTGQQRIAAVLPKDGKLIHKTGSGFPS
ncbi:MAG: serine hydrolase, partial [Alloprevotella sp.]|nr:serine hydrolase [Alloprevotella sp.]